jgi:hypothetical protein
VNDQPAGSNQAQEVRDALHQLLDLLADRVAEKLIDEHKKRTRRPADADNSTPTAIPQPTPARRIADE